MNDLTGLKTKIESANTILVVTADKPSLDDVAASLALYLTLKGAGKNVTVASNQDPIVRDSRLVGLDQIKNEIGSEALVINFNRKTEDIEKVWHDESGGAFTLYVRPAKNATPITEKDLSLSMYGAAADLVIVVGVSDLAEAGDILAKEQELLEKTTIANVSNKPGTFGAINLVDPNASLSEIAAALIQELGLQLTSDAAQNLMFGIEEATDNLQSRDMTADTFEALAMLYRAGARRRMGIEPTKEEIESAQEVTKAIQKQAKKQDNTQKEDQPDWLKPKIYKGSTRV